MISPFQIIEKRVGSLPAAAVLDDLRVNGWIVVRHDAIKLAQAHARADVASTAQRSERRPPDGDLHARRPSPAANGFATRGDRLWDIGIANSRSLRL